MGDKKGVPSAVSVLVTGAVMTEQHSQRLKQQTLVLSLEAEVPGQAPRMLGLVRPLADSRMVALRVSSCG